MGLKTITVPAAGVNESFDLTGISVVVVAAPSYFSPLEAPILSFNDPGMKLPVENGNQWENPAGHFKNIVITGTSESAGDEVTLLSVPLCIGSRRNQNISDTSKSIAGATQTKPASDAVQQFSNSELTDSEGNLPKRLYIWVVGGATAGINFAYDADPAQGLNATDAQQWDNDQSNASTADHEIQLRALEIEGIDWIEKFRFIATVATETPNLVWTPEY